MEDIQKKSGDRENPAGETTLDLLTLLRDLIGRKKEEETKSKLATVVY